MLHQLLFFLISIHNPLDVFQWFDIKFQVFNPIGVTTIFIVTVSKSQTHVHINNSGSVVLTQKLRSWLKVQLICASSCSTSLEALYGWSKNPTYRQTWKMNTDGNESPYMFQLLDTYHEVSGRCQHLTWTQHAFWNCCVS